MHIAIMLRKVARLTIPTSEALVADARFAIASRAVAPGTRWAVIQIEARVLRVIPVDRVVIIFHILITVIIRHIFASLYRHMGLAFVVGPDGPCPCCR